jgi:hypothetical protein
LGPQFVMYGGGAIVFSALTGLGILPTRFLDRLYPLPRLIRPPVLAISGWGLATLVSGIAALCSFDQVWLARALLVLGLVLLVPFRPAVRPQQIALLTDLALLIVLMAPMGLLVAGTPAAGFDEFAHWLPNARYLVERGHYWVQPEWLGVSSAPGYPNASAVIALLVCQLTGPEVEAPFKTFVVILLGAFGAVLAELVSARIALPRGEGRVMRLSSVALLAGGGLVALIAPFVDPRFTFSAYTDTPSGIVAGVAALLACRGVDAARRGASHATDTWFAWAGLLLLTLVLLRTTNLVLAAAIVLACGAIILVLRVGDLRARVRWALLLVVPASIGELVWQAYKYAAGIPAELSPMPLAEWNWSAPVTLARALFLDRLAGNPAAGAAAVGLVALVIAGAIIVWFRPVRGATDDDRSSARIVAAMTAIICICFTCFILWAYIAVIQRKDTAIAISLWRYMSQLGPLVVLAGFCMAIALVPRGPLGKSVNFTTLIVAVICLVLLPVVGRAYYRLDCRFPDVVAAREAVDQMRPALAALRASAPRPAWVAVVNPAAGDWMAWAAAFDLRWVMNSGSQWGSKSERGAFDLNDGPWLTPDAHMGYRVETEPLRDTEDWAWDQRIDGLLDFRALDRFALTRISNIPSVSLLGRPTAKGDAWPVLATTISTASPRCAIWQR